MFNKCIIACFFIGSAHIYTMDSSSSINNALLPELHRVIIQHGLADYKDFWDIQPFLFKLTYLDKYWNKLVKSEKCIQDIISYWKVPHYTAALASGNKLYVENNEFCFNYMVKTQRNENFWNNLPKVLSAYQIDIHYTKIVKSSMCDFLYPARFNIEFFKILLEKGINPNKSNITINCLKKCFSESEGLALLTALHKSNVDFNAQRSLNLDTPLTKACNRNWYQVADFLLRLGMNPNLQNINGATALHLIVSRKIDNELPQEEKNAIIDDQLKWIQLLYKYKADPLICDYTKKIPYDYARYPSIKKSVQVPAQECYIYENPNQCNTWLHYKAGRSVSSQSLAFFKPTHDKDQRGHVPMHDYAEFSDLKKIKALVAGKEDALKDIHEINCFGQNPCHILLRSQHQERSKKALKIMKMFMQEGANFYSRDYKNKKPHYYLASNKGIEDKAYNKMILLLANKKNRKRKRNEEREDYSKKRRLD